MSPAMKTSLQIGTLTLLPTLLQASLETECMPARYNTPNTTHIKWKKRRTNTPHKQYNELAATYNTNTGSGDGCGLQYKYRVEYM